VAVWWSLRAAGVEDQAAFGRGALYAALAGAAVGVALLAVHSLLDRRVLGPASGLAREVATLVQSRQLDRALECPARHWLGTLPEAVGGLADALRLARRDSLRAAEAATARIAEQKGWLEVILLDLSEGVVVCNAKHQILLYNPSAARILGDPEAVGLGRSLLGLVTRQPVIHTLERLEWRRDEGGAASDLSAPFVCATADASLMLQGRMALILGPVREVTGYVVTLTDISAEIANLAKSDAVRRALTRGLRGPIANLRAAAESLLSFPGMAPGERLAFERVVVEEATRISDQIEALAAAYRGHSLARWPMADVYSTDLFNCVARRLDADGITLTPIGMPMWLHGDSHSLVMALTEISRRVRDFSGASAQDVEALLGDRRVYVDIAWDGKPVPSAEIERWQDAPLDGLLGNQAIRDVLERHGSELWSQPRPHGRAMLRVPLLAPLGPHFRERAETLPPRPEFYDFGLMREHSVAGELADRPLRHLDYVVFDTETTGLLPSEGDEIVSLAGVRVVNGRVLTGERFERLVNPQRAIPRDSIRFHGITDEMVIDKPPVHVVLPQFKAFVGDAVLVAHNAAFDLKFIKLKEAECGLSFQNPVLDTLLLSALVDPDEDDHSLDGLTKRLDVTITDRHSALGDALATAEVLVRLIDRLEAKGIATLGQVLTVSNMTAELRLREARH
ncbi:MAG: PAS domain-containing protein, partial [Alphaproteobacteria bacterium]|nr:PAS domain-containing protein [Alphaproteobacteria bacterium]